MEITQEERLDLTDKQVREIWQDNTISAIENTLGILSTRQTIEDFKAENEKLKNELDKQIKDNRKLVKALKKYAYEGNWECLFYDKVYGKDSDTNWNNDGNGYDLAQQVLKEVGEEEC